MSKLIPLTVETAVPDACGLTPAQYPGRIDLINRLAADALIARDRTVDGVRLRFRADDGIEARVRELATLESECCPSVEWTVTALGGEVLWDARPVHPEGREIIDGLLTLPLAPSKNADDSPSRKGRAGTTGTMLAAVACMLACAAPGLFVGLGAGATASWIGIPVWGWCAVVMLAVVGAVWWAKRRQACATADSCGC